MRHATVAHSSRSHSSRGSSMIRWLFVFAGLIAFVSLAGCGGFTPPEGVVVPGKVVQGGQPVSITPTPDGYNGVHVHFVPALGEGSGTADAEEMCDASGNFKIL